MEIDDILSKVSEYSVRFVTVTGGEPLAQKDCLELLSRLCDADYEVSIETSGALDVCEVDNRVVKVMDLKTPASGELEKNRYENIACLSSQDQVKFVLAGRADYDWAKEKIEQHDLSKRCEILFSPVYGTLDATQLAEWILADHLPVRMQVQLHKILWGEEPGH